MANNVNPNPKEVEEMVAGLKEWISKQPHLPQLTDDKLLTKFLVCCKYRLQETKTKIDNYYSARSLVPDLFQNRDPTAPGIRKNADNDAMFLLPETTKDGYTVLITSAGGDPADFVYEDAHKRMFMMVDLWFHNDTFNPDMIMVFDFATFTLQHFLKLSPRSKEIANIVQNVLPFRLKAIHYINVSPFVHKFVDFFKQFATPKLRERFHVHKDMKTFHDAIGNPEILPSDFGGKQPSLAEMNDAYQKKLESYKSWFAEEDLIRSNEDLRPPNSKHTWLSGTEGSFKKLSVD